MKGLKIRPPEQRRGSWHGEARSLGSSSRKPSGDQLEVFLPRVSLRTLGLRCAPSHTPSHFYEAFSEFFHIRGSLTPQVEWVIVAAVVVVMTGIMKEA